MVREATAASHRWSNSQERRDTTAQLRRVCVQGPGLDPLQLTHLQSQGCSDRWSLKPRRWVLIALLPALQRGPQEFRHLESGPIAFTTCIFRNPSGFLTLRFYQQPVVVHKSIICISAAEKKHFKITGAMKATCDTLHKSTLLQTHRIELDFRKHDRQTDLSQTPHLTLSNTIPKKQWC